MVVRLDEMPAPVPQPALPRLRVWLGLLLICVALGGGWFFGWLKAQWQKSLDAFGGLPSVYLF